MSIFQKSPITLLAMSLFLTACGVKESKKSGEGTSSLNNAAYVVVDNQNLTSTAESINGNGSLVFVAPLTEDGNNFNLAFELQDSGSLTLVAGSDNKLQQGLSLTFSRDGQNLNLVTKAGTSSSSAIAVSGIDASQQIALNFDVHNDETPAHVLVWKNSDTTDLLIDTEEGTAAAGNGQGNLWGLILNAAKITRAEVRTAANEE